MSLNRVVFSSKSNDWGTPEAVYRELNAEFCFDCDPCPLNAAPLPLFGSLDALTQIWGKRVFCNPPYYAISRFIDKAWRSIKGGDSELIIFLLPARTDTAWFHEQILNKAEIRFIRGRLKFGGALNNAPFPSMVCVLRS